MDRKSCVYCKLLEKLTNRRFYFESDHFVVVENLFTMSPILVSTKHECLGIPVQAFQVISNIATKLYGKDYSFLVTKPEEPHYAIKVVQLSSETDLLPNSPPIPELEITF